MPQHLRDDGHLLSRPPQHAGGGRGRHGRHLGIENFARTAGDARHSKMQPQLGRPEQAAPNIAIALDPSGLLPRDPVKTRGSLSFSAFCRENRKLPDLDSNQD